MGGEPCSLTWEIDGRTALAWLRKALLCTLGIMWLKGALLLATASTAACGSRVLIAGSGAASGSGSGGSTASGSGTSSNGGSTTSSSTTITTATTSSSGCVMTTATFAGKASLQLGSEWSYKGETGLAAGNLVCTDIGADHVCDYDEVVLAAAKAEFTGLATTDTAWLQRTHAVTVAAGLNIEVLGLAVPNAMEPAGTVLEVNSGSRGADWTYAGSHLNECEFVSFESGLDTPTYHLDDNPCVVQSPPGDVSCGHNTLPRDVLCCFPRTCAAPAASDCTCDQTKMPPVCP